MLFLDAFQESTNSKKEKQSFMAVMEGFISKFFVKPLQKINHRKAWSHFTNGCNQSFSDSLKRA
jgi:hypothetical protein